MNYAELSVAQNQRAKEFSKAQTDAMVAYCNAEHDLRELQAENAKLREEDGIRVRRHRYVCPVRCIDCKHSYTAKAEGKLRRLCGFVLGYRDDDGYCDRGERRG